MRSPGKNGDIQNIAEKLTTKLRHTQIHAHPKVNNEFELNKTRKKQNRNNFGKRGESKIKKHT